MKIGKSSSVKDNSWDSSKVGRCTSFQRRGRAGVGVGAGEGEGRGGKVGVEIGILLGTILGVSAG